MQNVFGFSNNNRVARIGSTLSSNNDVRLLSHEINDFAFAFIAPLGTH